MTFNSLEIRRRRKIIIIFFFFFFPSRLPSRQGRRRLFLFSCIALKKVRREKLGKNYNNMQKGGGAHPAQSQEGRKKKGGG